MTNTDGRTTNAVRRDSIPTPRFWEKLLLKESVPSLLSHPPLSLFYWRSPWSLHSCQTKHDRLDTEHGVKQSNLSTIRQLSTP